MAHRSAVLAQQRAQSSTSKLAKYQVPRYPEEVGLRQQSSSNKPILQRSSTSYGEHATEEKKKESNINGKIIKIVVCTVFCSPTGLFIKKIIFTEKETAFVTTSSSLSHSKNSTSETNCNASDSKAKLLNRNSSSMDSSNGPGCSSSS